MKEKWQSIRGFFRKNSRKLIPLLLLAAILLPIVVDNSYVSLLSVMPGFCAWVRTRQPS
mgnify:CR=1 FL=1